MKKFGRKSNKAFPLIGTKLKHPNRQIKTEQIPKDVEHMQQTLSNSYKAQLKDSDIPDGYKIDKDLSNSRTKVYRNSSDGKAIVAHRGSANSGDWRDNFLHAVGVDVHKTKTYKKHKANQDKIDKVIRPEDQTLMGHSRGGLYVETLNKDKKGAYKNVITYNKAAALQDIGKTVGKNQLDFRHNKDVISVLSKTQKGGKTKTFHGGNVGFNLLKAHSTDILNKVK